MSKEAMKLALEALERVKDGHWDGDTVAGRKLFANLRQAIEQAQKQEPVAQYSDIVSDGGLDPRNKFDAPLQRQPLDMSQIVQLTYDIDEDKPATMAELFRFARAIEAAHGITGEQK